MKWFKHYSNASSSNDLTKVRMKYGADGYAIYWYCLELIAHDLGSVQTITFELKHDAEVIGYNLKIDSLRVEEIMRYMVELGLFENAEGTVTCIKLAKYLDKKTTRNPTIHKIIDSASDLHTLSRTVSDSPPTVPDCPPLDTDTDTDTDKKKVQESVQFEKFWDAYPRKENKKRTLSAWAALCNSDRDAAIDGIAKRQWDKDKKFQMLPSTYLNGRRWEDESGTTPQKFGKVI